MSYPFEKVFGNTPELRVIEFLLPTIKYTDDFLYTKKELCEECYCRSKRMRKCLKRLLKFKILIKIKKMYKLNPDSLIVNRMININVILITLMEDDKLKDFVFGQS